MRQVPASYLIIGSGRMAKHFCHYLSLLKLPYYQWARNTHTENALHSIIPDFSHILLLINDGEIDSFTKQLPIHQAQILVHFSGQLSLDNIHSAHPLCTFAHELYNSEIYQSIPFILTEGSPPLSILLPGLPNAAYHITQEQKAFYHALCVLSGNFTCILWKKFFHELEKTLNLPPEVGIPYLNQISYNLRNNPQGALTGPLARKDNNTIQANLNALKNDEFLIIYQAFANLFA